MLKRVAAGALSCLLFALPVQAAADTPHAAFSPEKKRQLLQSLDALSPQEKAQARQTIAVQGKPFAQAKIWQYPDSKYLLDGIDFRNEGHHLVYVLQFKPQYADSLSSRLARPQTQMQTMVCELEQRSAWLSLIQKLDVRHIVFRLQAGSKQLEKRFSIKDLLAKCSSR